VISPAARTAPRIPSKRAGRQRMAFMTTTVGGGGCPVIGPATDRARLPPPPRDGVPIRSGGRSGTRPGRRIVFGVGPLQEVAR
jgi:hypothetical protein